MSSPPRLRLLILNLFAVHPPDTGAKVVIWNRIVELSRSFDVTFCFRDDPHRPVERASMDELRRHARVVRIPPALDGTRWHAAADALRQPAVRLFDRAVRSWLRHPDALALREERFDVVELHSSCWFRDEVTAFSGIRVLVAHNDEAEYWRAQALAARGIDRLGARFDALQARRQQRAALAACDALVTLSERDLEILRSAIGDRPATANPGGVDCAAYRPAADHFPVASGNLVLVATYVDAVAESTRRFVDRVLPDLRASDPDVSLRLVGDHRDHPRLTPLRERPGVQLVGRAPDVVRELRDAAIVVAPIESGSGVRLKILEACAAGRALVTTAKGAEGLDLIDGTHALIVPDLEAMGPAIHRLMRDPELRRRLGDAARRLAVERYDRRAGHDRLADWYRGLVGRLPGRPGRSVARAIRTSGRPR